MILTLLLLVACGDAPEPPVAEAPAPIASTPEPAVPQPVETPAVETPAVEAPATSGPAQLCKEGEQLIYGAVVEGKDKFVALCGSADLGEGAGYLQYRFGAPGKVELEYPAQTEGSRQKFSYTRETGPQVTFLSLSFVNNDVNYKISDEDYHGETARSIVVTPPGKASVEIALGEAAGSLMRLEGVVAEGG